MTRQCSVSDNNDTEGQSLGDILQFDENNYLKEHFNAAAWLRTHHRCVETEQTRFTFIINLNDNAKYYSSRLKRSSNNDTA